MEYLVLRHCREGVALALTDRSLALPVGGILEPFVGYVPCIRLNGITGQDSVGTGSKGQFKTGHDWRFGWYYFWRNQTILIDYGIVG